MESTCYNIFTKKKKNPKVMILPPTSANFLQNMFWAHLQMLIVKILHVSQTLGGSFESKCIYWSLLTTGWSRSCSIWVTRCHSVHGKKCSMEVCRRQKQHSILQLSWWTGLLESIHCNQGNFQVICRGHCETDYIDSNLPDDSGDGLE